MSIEFIMRRMCKPSATHLHPELCQLLMQLANEPAQMRRQCLLN
jgi:hypothetical protein